jgi:cell wall-associated NlpC family hydrolase
MNGTQVDVTELRTGWAKVRFESGSTGWIARALLRMPPTETPAASGDVTGRALVETAKQYLGVPYRWGGSSRGGVDCSGLVYAVCLQHGIKLPRRARDMWGRGAPVGKDELQAGDVVFFRDTYRNGISHVGFYLANGDFIHASTRGRQVRVSNLGESYYVQHWAGAYRLTD